MIHRIIADVFIAVCSGAFGGIVTVLSFAWFSKPSGNDDDMASGFAMVALTPVMAVISAIIGVAIWERTR